MARPALNSVRYTRVERRLLVRNYDCSTATAKQQIEQNRPLLRFLSDALPLNARVAPPSTTLTFHPNPEPDRPPPIPLRCPSAPSESLASATCSCKWRVALRSRPLSDDSSQRCAREIRRFPETPLQLLGKHNQARPLSEDFLQRCAREIRPGRTGV